MPLLPLGQRPLLLAALDTATAGRVSASGREISQAHIGSQVIEEAVTASALLAILWLVRIQLTAAAAAPTFIAPARLAPPLRLRSRRSRSRSRSSS
eukprot:COSAG01_NODE_21920_length_879_cov_1.553846_1_plen_95_part_10